jgi:hypothetical protein
MIRRLLQRQQGGVALAMVLGFIVLAVPLVTSALSLASTLSIDSRVKTNVMRCHYSALGVRGPCPIPPSLRVRLRRHHPRRR